MKLSKVKRLLLAAALAATSLVALPAAPAAAANTCVWVPTNSSGNFSTAANWTGCGGLAPQDGDSVVIANNQATPSVLTINLDVNRRLDGISFTTSNADIVMSSGNGSGISLNGNINDTSGSSSDVYMRVDLSLFSDAAFYGSSAIAIGSGPSTTLDVSVHTLTVTTTADIKSKLSGSASGLIQVGFTNPAKLTIHEPTNDYAGAMTVSSSGAQLLFDHPGALGNISSLDVNTGGVVAFSFLGADANGVVNVTTPIDLSGAGSGGFAVIGAGVTPQNTSLNFTDVTLGSDVTFNGNGDADSQFNFTNATLNGNNVTALDGSQGTLKVNGTAIKADPLVTIVNSANAGSYNTGTVGTPLLATDNRPLYIQASMPTAFFGVQKGGLIRMDGGTIGGVRVYSGGSLNGAGDSGATVVEVGGVLSPGLAGTAGCLSSGNLIVDGTFKAELHGTTACTGYDQLKVTGTTDVSNGTLVVALGSGYTPAIGDTFTIIDNDGSDAVGVSFTGLVEGATFTQDGVTYKITYAGGSNNNDIVLTVTNTDAATAAASAAAAAAAKAPGTPNTGLALVSAHPLASFAVTTAAAFAILIASRRMQPITKK